MPSTFTASHRGGSGEPLVLVHGFTDTWRSWELVLPELERHHDVLAPTLPGHAGGPPLDGALTEETLSAAVEAAMDEAGFETAHVAGNSLGGYVALQLAARGRARSVTAMAPAGGWAVGDESFRDTLTFFAAMHEQIKAIAAHADAIAATPDGRRRATEFIAVNWEAIPADLIAHQIAGAAQCEVGAMIEFVLEHGYSLDAERIECPVRIVWGTEDRILGWPRTAERYRSDWLPNADWVELEGVGHCPQLDVPTEATQLILGMTGG